MKKIILLLILVTFAITLPRHIHASKDLIKPSSKLYFLQSWGESIKLFFTFSKEQKLNYLLQLTEKRVDEMNSVPSSDIADRYKEHFRQLEKLTTQTQNKQTVVEKIKETSLRQQETLAEVYNRVPQQARDAIINAQENSSKHVAKTIEAVEGPQKAQEYILRVTMIQQVEKTVQRELMEQAPMEGSPNADPSKNTPKELKGTNELNDQQELKSVNPLLENKGEGTGNKPMEPAQPAQMNAPAGQN